MPQKRNSLSIVIVTYNSIDHIHTCLNCVAEQTAAYRTQLLLVDNNSVDATQDWLLNHKKELHHCFDDVIIILNKRNQGYTKGINQGLEHCSGEYILLLNPDVKITSDVFQPLLSCFKRDRDIGIVAPQFLYPSGSVQSSCRRFPTKRDLFFEIVGLSRVFSQSPFFNRWKMPDFDHRQSRFVEQPQGAFLLTTAGVFKQIGFLDERFPMFFSDVDWCKRIIDHGLKIYFCAETAVFHHHGASVNRCKDKMIVSSHRSFIRYLWLYSDRPRPLMRFLQFILLVITLPRIMLEDKLITR